LHKSICVRAFAKVNLGLKILAKRPDNYHEIRTIYQTVALHDLLEISLLKSQGEVEVECEAPGIPQGPANLVYRACELWRRAQNSRVGIRIRLEKMIPAGSGLGGASSDAAATLLALERLSGDRLDDPSRFGLASELGSDVPLFLVGGRVLGCGRGEEVYPLVDLPTRSCLIAYPGFSIYTAEAYRGASLRLTKKAKVPSMFNFGAWPQLSLSEWGPAENDFEGVVFAKWPELALLKRQLIRAGAETASLTGSGSAVYGIFRSARQLVRASKIIPEGWLSFRTRTLSRAAYRRLLIAK
jgi:4-diphosphocytidyl-2-C-methyl-D-erythritol kinase